jgi:plasmid stabilization system protein ParE
MAGLTWTEPALRQLEEIIELIALDKPEAAAKTAQSIFAAADHVEKFKLLGRKIPEFPVPGYRQLWIRPCWIYYRVVNEDVFVLHVRRAESPFRVEFLDER